MTAYINKILRFITILLLLFAAAFGFDESMTTITLYAAIPAAFGLSILQHGNPLAGNRYIKWLLVLYLWICCTYIGAEYVEEANRQMSQILGVVLMGATLSNMSKDENNLKWAINDHTFNDYPRLHTGINYIMHSGNATNAQINVKERYL